MPPSDPPILTYDSHNITKEKRSSRVMPGYCAGVLFMGLAYCGLAFWMTRRYPDVLSRIIYGLIFPPSFALVSLLPQCISLGLTLWLKQKFFIDVRFRGFGAAFLWGIGGGLAPWGLFPIFQNADMPIAAFWFANLAWYVIFPIFGGLLLCYRSHLRD